MSTKVGNNNICLIFGNHFNAHSIIRSLITISIPTESIWIVKTLGTPTFSAEFFNRSIQTWEIDINNVFELPDKIRKRFGSKQKKVLYFTDERFLTAFNKLENQSGFNDFTFFVGSKKNLNTILDRMDFYRFIDQYSLAAVPKTIKGNKNPFSKLGNHIVIRPRISWKSLTDRPQVSIVSSIYELEKAITIFREAGLSPEEWCYQEVLSTDVMHNVSVCGWYDDRTQYLFCTRKILQHPTPCGNGDVIELISEPPGYVIEKSKDILEALEYEGPVEVEWIFDKNSNTYKVIEANPRFWMQHGLVDKISGQAVVRRYLGMNEDLPIDCTIYPQFKYWVNPLYALFRMTRGDFRGLRYYFSPNAMSPISLFQSVFYAPFHIRGKRAISNAVNI